jgi:hypothetical protein
VLVLNSFSLLEHAGLQDATTTRRRRRPSQAAHAAALAKALIGPKEKNQKAEDARNVTIIREGLNLEVERLRESLGEWIEENSHPANDTAISIAMLETAFDRYIDPLGATDAFELIESAFRRRAQMFRRSSTVTVAEFARRGQAAQQAVGTILNAERSKRKS